MQVYGCDRHRRCDCCVSISTRRHAGGCRGRPKDWCPTGMFPGRSEAIPVLRPGTHATAQFTLHRKEAMPREAMCSLRPVPVPTAITITIPGSPVSGQAHGGRYAPPSVPRCAMRKGRAVGAPAGGMPRVPGGCQGLARRRPRVSHHQCLHVKTKGFRGQRLL